MRFDIRGTLFCLAFFTTSSLIVAQENPAVEFSKTPFPKSLPESMSVALSQQSVRVTLGKQSASIWLRHEWPMQPKSSLPFMPGSLRTGAFVGVVQFSQRWLDFRGLELPAGVYSLRYARQPKSADHEDTSPSVDFLLLSPVSEERDIKDLSFSELKKLSGKSTGGTHPAAMVLMPVSKREDGLFYPKESWVGLQWKWNTEAGDGKLAAIIFGVWNGK